MPIFGNSGPNSSSVVVAGPYASQPAACPQPPNKSRSYLFATAAAFLLPMYVIGMMGESNTGPARNRMDELPSGLWATDPNAFIWDDGDTLGIGQAIRVLGAPAWSTVTVTIATPGVFTWVAHGQPDGTPVMLLTSGALPTGLATGTRYWIVNRTTDTFQLAATPGGPPIATSGTQSGTHKAFANPGVEQQPGGAAYVDPAYPLGVGPLPECTRHFRAANPTAPICYFVNQQGGGRFSDAASRGRTANYLYNLSNGAYAEMLASWNAFVAALAALGYYPNILAWRINLGGNTAFDATESSNFQTDLTNLITQLRTDIIGSSTKVVLDRYGALQSDINQTNYAVVKTAVHTIALADPTRVEVLALDGMPTVFAGGAGPDSIHLNVASHIAVGEALAYHALGFWYPQKEQSYNGGNPCAWEWRPGDYRNVYDGSGNLNTIYDLTNGGMSPTQGNSTKRPVIGSTTLSSGLVVRHGTGDGTDDDLVKVGGGKSVMDSAFGLFAVPKMAANDTKALYGEGGPTINPFMVLRSDASGNLTFFHRNDAGTVTGPTVIANGAFDNNPNFVAVWGDNGSYVKGAVNGVQGTQLNYTRGTTTIDRVAAWAMQYNNGVTDTFFAPLQLRHMWATDAAPDSTYLANAAGFTARRWGTPAPSGSSNLTAQTVAPGAPSITLSALGQVHALGPTDVVTTAPAISSTTFGQAHSLAATGVTTSSPEIGSGSVVFVANLTSLAVAAGTPVLGSATLGQAHALASLGISTGTAEVLSASVVRVANLAAVAVATSAPQLTTSALAVVTPITSQTVATSAAVVSSAAFGQVHTLTAQAVVAGTPVVSTVTFGQVHNLSSSAIAPAAPAIGLTTLGQVHALTAAQVAPGAAVVTQASMGGTISIASNTVATSAPIVATTTLGQVHSLTSSNVVSSAPSLSSATFGQVHALGSVTVALGAPALGVAVLGQTHVLGSTALATSAPAIAPASLSGAQGLVSLNVVAGTPVVSFSILAQTHALSALAIATTPPVLSSAALLTVHALGSQPVVTSAAALGSASLGQRHGLTSLGVATGVPRIGNVFLTYTLPVVAATFSRPTNRSFTGSLSRATFRKWPSETFRS